MKIMMKNAWTLESQIDYSQSWTESRIIVLMTGLTVRRKGMKIMMKKHEFGSSQRLNRK